MASTRDIKKRRFISHQLHLGFWWPIVLFVIVLNILWFQVPFSLLLEEPHQPHPVMTPHAALVTLEPDYAASVLKKIRSAWSSDDQAEKIPLEMGFIELSIPLPPLWTLDQTRHYPGKWSPSPSIPPSSPRYPIRLPATDRTGELLPEDSPLQPQPPHFQISLSASLSRAGFTFTPPPMEELSFGGRAVFEVITDEKGQILHILLLTPPRNDSLALIERALARGRAQKAASGRISCEWLHTQSSRK